MGFMKSNLSPDQTAGWTLAFLLISTGCSLRAAEVRFHLIDADSARATPAMVCISDSSGQVHLPPDGRIMTRPSSTREFYSGVEFNPDRNWIGPVRKMQGKGDNNDRSFVYELLPSIPYWREPVMYQTSGDFSIRLPEGEWRIAVERGMEYVPVVKTFRVRDEPELSHTIELRRWIDLPARGWWSGDVHVHHPTLRKAHRDFLLSYARASDLHLVNVLEMGHHLGTDFKQWGFGAKFRVQDGTYALVSGQEEPRSTFGHIIGLNTTSLARDLATYDYYDLAFQRIHQQRGALVGFAHFSWNGCDLPRGFPWYVTTGELDFIELLQFSRLNAMDYYDYLNLGFKLTAAAGSDTPWGSTIGEVRTYVHTGPEMNINAWFENLKKGHSFVSNGPALEFTVDGQLPGSELKRAAGDTVHIQARVLSHPAIGMPKALTLVGNEGVIQEATNPGGDLTELTLKLDRKIDQSQWLVVSAVCENNALAHTTPVYLVVDGRPTWSAQRGPAVVQKQLESIAGIEREFAGKNDDRARGIRERLVRARTYYENLRQRMKEEK
jgi:hypothetical protein